MAGRPAAPRRAAAVQYRVVNPGSHPLGDRSTQPGDTALDLDDTPEQAEFRARARAWLNERRQEAPPRAGSSEDGGYIGARRAWQRRLAEAGLAGVAWPARYGGQGLGAIEQVTANQEIRRAGVPGVLDVIGTGMLGPCLIAHGSDEQCRATWGRCCTATRSGASCSQSRRRARTSRRSRPARARARTAASAQRPEGVDDQRAVRLLRDAAGAHRPRRAQAQGSDDVRRADGRTRRDRPGAGGDLGRGGIQRGVLRRPRGRTRRRRRRDQQRLGRGNDDPDVRAADDRLRLENFGSPAELARTMAADETASRDTEMRGPARPRDDRADRGAVQRLPDADPALFAAGSPAPRRALAKVTMVNAAVPRDRSRRRHRRPRRSSRTTPTGTT